VGKPAQAFFEWELAEVGYFVTIETTPRAASDIIGAKRRETIIANSF